MRTVLMLAYVFPPFFSVGGSIRVVKFVKYLPGLGWRPLVLTIDDRRETVSQRREGSEILLKEIPPEAQVYRTGSGEPSAHLQQKGREARDRSRLAAPLVNLLSGLRRLAYRTILLPDAHITWLPSALKWGRQVVRDERVDVLWVTCPPHSAALIGAALKRLTGRPMVLDYRDDWIDTPWHRSKPRTVRWIERRLERWAVRTADRVVLVTQASREAFIARYPHQAADKFVLIPNGCDLDDFAVVRRMEVPAHEDFRIVHAGLLCADHGWHRSPESLFQALQRTVYDCPEMARRLSVTFTGRLPEPYRRQVESNGLSGLVHETGFLPHDAFLRLLREADLLLAINYEGFGTLIPGKLYEYWAVGRAPILLIDGEGAARRLVQEHGLGLCVEPDDVEGITEAIVEAYRQRQAGTPMRINTDGLGRYDRKALTRQLAKLFGEVSSSAA
jgi:glycosyltransferase involved in cell wall biosynthesis